MSEKNIKINYDSMKKAIKDLNILLNELEQIDYSINGLSFYSSHQSKGQAANKMCYIVKDNYKSTTNAFKNLIYNTILFFEKAMEEYKSVDDKLKNKILGE